MTMMKVFVRSSTMPKPKPKGGGKKKKGGKGGY
jgi:hypothetical protein